MIKKFISATVLVLCSFAVFGQDLKIGVVNTGRILRDSAPAKVAQQKLENEFSKRQKEIEDLSLRLKWLIWIVTYNDANVSSGRI